MSNTFTDDAIKAEQMFGADYADWCCLLWTVFGRHGGAA